MSRKVEFRMERAGLIQVGDHVELKEDVASTMAGMMCYYTIRDAVAMSNNLKLRDRLKRLDGTVSAIEAKESYWTVTVEVEE